MGQNRSASCWRAYAGLKTVIGFGKLQPAPSKRDRDSQRRLLNRTACSCRAICFSRLAVLTSDPARPAVAWLIWIFSRALLLLPTQSSRFSAKELFIKSTAVPLPG